MKHGCAIRTRAMMALTSNRNAIVRNTVLGTRAMMVVASKRAGCATHMRVPTDRLWKTKRIAPIPVQDIAATMVLA